MNPEKPAISILFSICCSRNTKQADIAPRETAHETRPLLPLESICLAFPDHAREFPKLHGTEKTTPSQEARLMTARRFVLMAIAGLLLAGASISPAITGISVRKSNTVQVADGWPPPEECGLYDICRVTVKS
jgi:hypothetical protein